MPEIIYPLINSFWEIVPADWKARQMQNHVQCEVNVNENSGQRYAEVLILKFNPKPKLYNSMRMVSVGDMHLKLKVDLRNIEKTLQGENESICGQTNRRINKWIHYSQIFVACDARIFDYMEC